MPAGIDASRSLARIAREIKDWRYLEASAAAAQLRPRLAAFLQGVELTSEAALAGRAVLIAEARAHAGRARLLAAELVRVLESLASTGIVAVPFKGPVFAAVVGGGLHGREMNDLDLLIGESELARAVDVLAPMGYAPTIASQASASRWLPRVACELPLASSSTLIELHWRLAPPWYRAPVTLAQLRSRLSPRDFFGASVSWPAPEELLLAHVADGMKIGAFGMRWVGDIAAILRHETKLDWMRVESVARANGALNNVRVTLAIVEDLGEIAAHLLEDSRAAIALPARARALASEARGSRRLAAAVRSGARRLAGDAGLEGATASFAWALQVSDSRLRAATAIARHLAGPSVTDLEAMPRGGSRDASLRARALARRLGLGAR